MVAEDDNTRQQILLFLVWYLFYMWFLLFPEKITFGRSSWVHSACCCCCCVCIFDCGERIIVCRCTDTKSGTLIILYFGTKWWKSTHRLRHTHAPYTTCTVSREEKRTFNTEKTRIWGDEAHSACLSNGNTRERRRKLKPSLRRLLRVYSDSNSNSDTVRLVRRKTWMRNE